MTIVTIKNAHYTTEGIFLAFLSGGISSRIGYTIWYIAFGGLSAMQTAVVQLSVPIIAAAGEIIFVSKALSLRFILSATMILGGIFIVVIGKHIFLRLMDKE